MKRVLALGAGLALVAAAAAVGAPSAGAAVTTTPVVPLVQEIPLSSEVTEAAPPAAFVFVLHGLNLDGQESQDDGGTPVTVCIDGNDVLPNFQFGDISPGGLLAFGTTLAITVHAGADVGCAGPALITQAVTVPAAELVALVATAAPDAGPTILAVPLDTEPLSGCIQPDSVENEDEAANGAYSRLGAVHAASAGEVSVTVDGDEPGDLLSFGDATFADFPPDTYTLGVTVGATPIIEADITTAPCTMTVVYVVGNVSIGEPDPAVDPAVRPAFTG